MNVEKGLIRAVVDGDRQAYSQLYTLFLDRVYNTALSYTKNHEEAEEITQDVFVKIFVNISKFQYKSSLSTWVYRITVNTALNFLRKRKKYSFVDTTITTIDRHIDFEHPGVLLENKEDASTLYQVMYDLPDNQKTAFILSYIEELPRKEVARIMEISLKSVEGLLQRAKKNMRTKLYKLYPNRSSK